MHQTHHSLSPIYFLVLKKNGSAVDASIASALCIGVVNSFATGKGTNHEQASLNCVIFIGSYLFHL